MNSAELKKFARDVVGVDNIGIANIERFDSAPPYMHPKAIMPECKSVIVFTRRILRGCLRGIEEGTHWPSYQVFAYAGLTKLIHQANYRIGRFIEDHGFDAVPAPPAATLKEAGPRGPVPEGGKYPRNINISVRIAAVLAGLGEMGWSKVFLSEDYGPRQRIGVILTDAELEAYEIKIGHICDRCKLCARDCPGDAIDKNKTNSFDAANHHWECADLNLGKCKLTHFGLNRVTSPHFVKTFPGIFLPMEEQGNTWVEGWNFGHALFSALPTYQAFSAYPIAICGARGCIISCMNHLEKRKRIRNLFSTAFTDSKPPWRLPEKPLKYHKDHHGFTYDPDNTDNSGDGGIQSNWY
jgi:ferredoxin